MKNLRPLWTDESGLRTILDSLGEGVVVADETGRILLFNPVAEAIVGMGAKAVAPGEWPHTYGVFRTDRTTPFPADELPLSRALRGESVRDVEMFVRNEGVPDGVFISVTGSPLRDASGSIRGGVVVFRDVTHRRTLQQESEELIVELRRALAEVKTLSGLLPICSACKKVRDDQGYWSEVEHYVSRHTTAKFSHGLCPACAETLYPSLTEKIRARSKAEPE